MSSLVRRSAGTFSVVENQLEAMLAEQLTIQTGQRPSPGERRSWARSLPVLAADLVEAGLPGVEMLMEYRLPLTSKRADVVLAGVGRETGDPAYMVVELKQWTHASEFEDSDMLVKVPGYGRPVTHPMDQVRDYCEYLVDFTRSLHGDDQPVFGVAYLHNADDAGVHELLGRPEDHYGRMFTGQRRDEFHRLLREVFAETSGGQAADMLLGSSIGPSKQLLAVAADEVQNREQFVLLDEQRDAYNYVLHCVSNAHRANTKTAVIVSGGPGSGKSVIALSLMGELARQGRSVVHATGSRSFTQTLRKVAAFRAPRVRKAFQYFNSFMEADPNDLDCLVLDEAHRIRETSANRFTRAALRTGRPQVDELLSAARVPVFLLDEHQVVRPGELGTASDIEKAAQERGIDVMRVDLDSQFRCGGSLEYVQWVQRLLELEVGEPGAPPDDFETRVMDSPEELESWLRQRLSEGYGARMAAGYCWPWSDPRRDGTLIPDVTIGDWQRPWNLKGERSVGGAPQAALWATDDRGFDQVGCVYTAQGFEYDYAGVIIGPDLLWRDGRWISDRSANKDPDFRNRDRVPDADFDRLVRHVYKVLLTRGLRGVGIYATDKASRRRLAEIVNLAAGVPRPLDASYGRRPLGVEKQPDVSEPRRDREDQDA